MPFCKVFSKIGIFLIPAGISAVIITDGVPADRIPADCIFAVCGLLGRTSVAADRIGIIVFRFQIRKGIRNILAVVIEINCITLSLVSVLS